MGQILHGSATTTHAVRAAIQRSKASVKELAARHGLDPKTVAKWKKRAFVHDAPMGPKEVRSSVLTQDEEAIAVAFRKHTLLPLDDCLYALQATIPHPRLKAGNALLCPMDKGATASRRSAHGLRLHANLCTCGLSGVARQGLHALGARSSTVLTHSRHSHVQHNKVGPWSELIVSTLPRIGPRQALKDRPCHCKKRTP